jgi:hypothetical protein
LGISIRQTCELCDPPGNLEKGFSQGNSTTCVCDFRLAWILLNHPHRSTSWERFDFRVHAIVPWLSLFFEATSILVRISHCLSSKLQDYADFLFDLVIAGSEQVQLEMFCPWLRRILGIRAAKSGPLSRPHEAIHFMGTKNNESTGTPQPVIACLHKAHAYK